MLGHLVILSLDHDQEIRGVLKKMDAVGVVVYCYQQQREIFFPMRRVMEIRDEGRAP